MPDKIIGYTFPDEPNYLPYREVITFGHPLLDYVTLYRARTQDQIDELEDRGVPRNKIVWGLAIGCNTAPGDFQKYNDLSLDGAIGLAKNVRVGGYAGITTWSLNRDTNHRYRQPENECTHLHTGEPDGAFIKGIFEELGI